MIYLGTGPVCAWHRIKPDLMVHICNPSAPEVEAGGSGVHGYPHPYNEFKTTLNYTTNTPKEPYKILSGTWLLGRLRQEDSYKLKTSLSYVENSRSVRATVYTYYHKNGKRIKK